MKGLINVALSQQDIFVYLLLGDNHFMVDQGAGNSSGAPCASNFSWLEDKHGWTGLMLDYDAYLIEESKKFRKNAISVCVDLLQVDFKKLYDYYKVPKVIDYLSIDIDPSNGILDPNVELLRRFPFNDYDFKILTIEHDFYNPHGPFQRDSLNRFMKDKTKYKLIVEDVGLAHETKNYLENWYINSEYFNEFKIKDIEKLYYYRENPNDIIVDLFARRK